MFLSSVRENVSYLECLLLSTVDHQEGSVSIHFKLEFLVLSWKKMDGVHRSIQSAFVDKSASFISFASPHYSSTTVNSCLLPVHPINTAEFILVLHNFIYRKKEQK